MIATMKADPKDVINRRRIMRDWSYEMLDLLGVEVEVIGKVPETPTLYLGNHMSYIDIMLLMAQNNIVFVTKKQLRSWPLIGPACDSVGTLWVDRNNPQSRKNVGDLIAPAILDDQKSIAIFPSGTTTMDEGKQWRWGAFQVAHQYKLPVCPFRLTYEPTRIAAFLLEDNLVTHLFRLLRQKKIKAKIEFHPLIEITSPTKDAEKWQKWTQEWLSPVTP